jgi:outer membrane protein assembly factor BamB
MPMSRNKGRILKILLLLGILSPVLGQIYNYCEAYFRGSQRQLMAIDAATGAVKWRANVPDDDYKFYSEPVILSRDRILVTQFPDGRGECAWIEFDRHSGRIVWRKSLKELGLDGCPAPYIAPVAQDGKLYTFWRKSINDGERSEQAIVAMDFTTHQVLWTSPIQMRWRDGSGAKQLMLADGKLIAGISDDKQLEKGIDLKALNLQTGNVIWQSYLDGTLSSNYRSRSRWINQGKSVIFRLSPIFQRSLQQNEERWLSYSTETGKPMATYTHAYPSSRSQKIFQIFPKDDQLYALGKSEVSTKVYSLLVAKMETTDGEIVLADQLPNLLTDRTCPDLEDVYVANSVFIALCDREVAGKRGEKKRIREVMALDAQTYKPRWQIASAGISLDIVVDVSGDRMFIDDQNEVRKTSAVTIKDGKVLWSLPISYTEKPVIDGDNLFVLAESRKEIWDIRQLLSRKT